MEPSTRQLPATRVIGAFLFVAVGAAATISGYYVDRDGTNIGSFSSVVPAGQAVYADGTASGAGVPKEATGAVILATGTVAYASGMADLVQHPERFPILPTTFSTLGQVK